MRKFFSSILLALFIFIVAVFAITILIKCDHSGMGKVFSFQPQNSTAASYVKPFCKNCNQYYQPKIFRGTPTDSSYLEVVKVHTDADELVGGEVYTVTAIVTLRDFDNAKTRIRCKVERDDIIVDFSVEFRDEFEESVSLLDEGDEITFHGRLYEDGFGWTECELIGE